MRSFTDMLWVDPTEKKKSINDQLHFPLEGSDPEPCIGCDFADDCAVSEKDCVAFRGWLNFGKIQDKRDIGRVRKKHTFRGKNILGK